jgi:N-acetylmuramoyl-L-alanine amidase
MRKVKKVIVHCTDSDDSLDVGVKAINEWHKVRGFVSPSGINCGYHYVVRRDGRIEAGRPESEIGAHAKGHNSDSIGVVWVGRKHITAAQSKAIKQLINTIRDKYSVPIDKVYGHCELDPHKTCPNLDMVKLRAELAFRAGV